MSHPNTPENRLLSKESVTEIRKWWAERSKTQHHSMEYRSHADEMVEICDMALRTYTAPEALRIPEGWKLVPIAPSDAMIEAGYESQLSSEWPADWSKNGTTPELYQAMAAYGAMLAAAPSVPSPLAPRRCKDCEKEYPCQAHSS